MRTTVDTTATRAADTTSDGSLVVEFGRFQLWVLVDPRPESGWPEGKSAATWVHDDGDEVTMVGWFVPASA